MWNVKRMTVKTKIKKVLKQLFNKNNYSDWTNKNIIVFGDSIVAGQELVREETPYRDIVYAKLASYYLHAHKLENFAETGTGQFKGQHRLDKLAGWTHSFEGSIAHYQKEIKDAQVVLIAYGNNDWKQPNPDGTLHSLDEVKDKLRSNIQHIRQINHNIQLVGILETIAFRKYKPAWNLKGPNGFTYAEMLSAFTEVYQECQIPIFDIRDYHLGNHIDEYVDDRDHFTLPVHKLIAKCLSDFVRHDYQSPSQRFGETVKFIFNDNLFDDSKTRQHLIQKINELSKQGKRSEILFFDWVDNYQKTLHKFIENCDFPSDLKITNIYQYYAAPLNYNEEVQIITEKDDVLINKYDVQFIQHDRDKFLLKQIDGNWSKEMTYDELKNLWLKHYISLKDEVFIVQNDECRSINPINI